MCLMLKKPFMIIYFLALDECKVVQEFCSYFVKIGYFSSLSVGTHDPWDTIIGQQTEPLRSTDIEYIQITGSKPAKVKHFLATSGVGQVSSW